MESVKLEGLNGSVIELYSCKVSEYPKVERQAQELATADTEKALAKVAADIVSSWLAGPDGKSTLSVDDLTMNDLWGILLAKAGPRKEIIRTYPETAAKAALDFFGGKMPEELTRKIYQALEGQIETGETEKKPGVKK